MYVGNSLTEGFTEHVAREILRMQNLKLTRPIGYHNEHVLATKLIDALGLTNLTDDYFHCTNKGADLLNQIGKHDAFLRLKEADEKIDKARKLAARQQRRVSDAEKERAYEKLRQFLETIAPAKGDFPMPPPGIRYA